MKTRKNLIDTILGKTLNSIFNFKSDKYWVYRMYLPTYDWKKYGIGPPKCKGEVISKKPELSLHYVELFKTRKEAKKAIKVAKYFQPWQEFVILSENGK